MDALFRPLAAAAIALAAAPTGLAQPADQHAANTPPPLTRLATPPKLRPTGAPKPSASQVHAAFDLSRPMVRRAAAPAPPTRGVAQASAEIAVPEPAPAGVTTPTERLAQLERAASEATSIHALGRLAALAEELADHSDAVRPDASRLASWAYAARGRRRAAEGRAEAALADFDRASELTPDDPAPRHERAVSLAERGADRQALEAFNTVIRDAPEWTAARRNRAAVLLRLGAAEAALKDCDAALRAGDADPAGLLELRARALQRLGRLHEAARDAAAAIAQSPPSASLLTLRGDVSAELGMTEQAVEDYVAALGVDAASAEAYRRLAWLLATTPNERLRDAETAVEAARRARRLGYGDDPLTLDASAAAHAAAGEFDEAVRFQQQAILAAGEGVTTGMNRRLRLYRRGAADASSGATVGAGAPAPGVKPVSYDARR